MAIPIAGSTQSSVANSCLASSIVPSIEWTDYRREWLKELMRVSAEGIVTLNSPFLTNSRLEEKFVPIT